MIEAAIQLGLITPEGGAALVKNGKTLDEWVIGSESLEMGEPREGKKRKLDRLWLLALLLFNFAVLAAVGWIALRVVRSL
jgi:hypothetical protein